MEWQKHRGKRKRGQAWQAWPTCTSKILLDRTGWLPANMCHGWLRLHLRLPPCRHCHVRAMQPRTMPSRSTSCLQPFRLILSSSRHVLFYPALFRLIRSLRLHVQLLFPFLVHPFVHLNTDQAGATPRPEALKSKQAGLRSVQFPPAQHSAAGPSSTHDWHHSPSASLGP